MRSPDDAELVRIVDAAAAEAARRAGELLRCRPGCMHCCIGPFAVTQRDLARLRRGLAAVEPGLRARILDRAQEAREVMRTGFPGDWESGSVVSQESADTFDLQHANLPCPVLDLETGSCTLHEYRPVACRLHGPALTVDGERLNYCRLNYPGTAPETVEAMRVAVKLSSWESSSLTYVAWI